MNPDRSQPGASRQSAATPNRSGQAMTDPMATGFAISGAVQVAGPRRAFTCQGHSSQFQLVHVEVPPTAQCEPCADRERCRTRRQRALIVRFGRRTFAENQPWLMDMHHGKHYARRFGSLHSLQFSNRCCTLVASLWSDTPHAATAKHRAQPLYSTKKTIGPTHCLSA